MDLATGVAVGGIALEIEQRAENIIIRHVKYITDYKKNVKDFRSYLELFEGRINGIQKDVDSCHRNLHEPRNDLEVFLRQCTEFKEVYAGDLEKLKGLNLERRENCCSRYKLSKKVIELEERMMKLTKNLNYNPPMVSEPPPKAVENIITKYVGFNSIEKAKADTMSAIKNTDTSVIGLHGMGGIGKTTLMQQINNELKNDPQSFAYVIMVTVSNSPNIKKLQDEIGRRVGLKFDHEIETTVRASRLLERLEKEKSILIIFDDVWNALDLSIVGIPCRGGENKCCKIVVTTRNEDVCKQMDAVPIIPMACLHPDESWELFESNSGVVESESIRAIVKDVCKQCAGLPLAIYIVASTLRHKTEEYTWNNFLSEMKESNSKELDGIESKVYTPLKLSYDHLESDDQKLCFLFCSLFPEDDEIDLRVLMYYGLGEGFVTCPGGVSSLDHTLFLIDKLKSRGLLLGADSGEMYVKMHDVVRDVAISITRNDEKFDFYTNFKDLEKWPEGGESETIKRISLMGNQIQHILDHPKFHGKWMKTLLLNDNRQLETIANNFFEEMEDLLILDMRKTRLELLPPSFQKLRELRVLMFPFFHTSIVVNVSDHLLSKKNLVVLILQRSRISELTEEFGELVHLKVLDFTMTEIDVIWPNVLSKLRNLEKLLMHGSFNRWNCSNESGKFVSFFELGLLRRLYDFQVSVLDQKIISKGEPPKFLHSLKFFIISIGVWYDDDDDLDGDDIVDLGNVKMLVLLQCTDASSDWIISLMKETETLYLGRSDVFQLFRLQNPEDYRCFENLREIKIKDCGDLTGRSVLLNSDMMKVLFNLTTLEVSSCKTFTVLIESSENNSGDVAILPRVDNIDLCHLDDMENIFVIPSQIAVGSFQSLKKIYIWKCKALKCIFTWNVAVCLVQLERLQINDCSSLEMIIGGKDDSDYYNKAQVVLFPKLRYMKLYWLPNLESLWQQQNKERMKMEWSSSLEWLSMSNCMKLKRLFLGEKSAPKLNYFRYLPEEWFDELQWEDEQAASRFRSIANSKSIMNCICVSIEKRRISKQQAAS